MFLAVERSRQETIEMLLCYGANVSFPNFSGITPISLCSENRRLVAVMNQQCKPASANLSRNGTEADGQDNADEPGHSVGKDADKDGKGGKKGSSIVSFIEVEPASLTTTASSDLNKAVDTKKPTSNPTNSKVETTTN